MFIYVKFINDKWNVVGIQTVECGMLLVFKRCQGCNIR